MCVCVYVCVATTAALVMSPCLLVETVCVRVHDACGRCFRSFHISACGHTSLSFIVIKGGTFPNRLFALSATSHGTNDNDPELLGDGYPQTTIFNHLDDAGVNVSVFVVAGTVLFLKALCCFGGVFGWWRCIVFGGVFSFLAVLARSAPFQYKI